MPRTLLVSILVLLFCAPGFAQEANEDVLVSFESPESQKRLMRSKHRADFFALANEYEPQINGGMCGPTSAVIVLNALRGPKDPRRPVDASAFPEERRKGLPSGWEPVKPRYTQRAFFDEKFAAVKPIERFYGVPAKDGKRDPGMQLRQLGKILILHGLEVAIRPVDDDMSSEEIKADLIANLKRPGDYVIVNYTRKKLAQKGGGHISPVGAYDEQSDSFLIMDTNPNNEPWTWIPAHKLIEAMRTKDTVENRGYLLVSE